MNIFLESPKGMTGNSGMAHNKIMAAMATSPNTAVGGSTTAANPTNRPYNRDTIAQTKNGHTDLNMLTRNSIIRTKRLLLVL